MELSTVEENGVKVVEGVAGLSFMQTTDDATLIIEACMPGRLERVLLYAENLTASFFDLSSLEAGAILQKLRNYGVRLAVVCVPGKVKFSSRFGEMVTEERRGRFFRIFETREAAREWLAS